MYTIYVNERERERENTSRVAQYDLIIPKTLKRNCPSYENAQLFEVKITYLPACLPATGQVKL